MHNSVVESSDLGMCLNLVAVFPIIGSILSHSSSSEANLIVTLSNATVFISTAFIHANYAVLK